MTAPPTAPVTAPIAAPAPALPESEPIARPESAPTAPPLTAPCPAFSQPLMSSSAHKQIVIPRPLFSRMDIETPAGEENASSPVYLPDALPSHPSRVFRQQLGAGVNFELL